MVGFGPYKQIKADKEQSGGKENEALGDDGEDESRPGPGDNSITLLARSYVLPEFVGISQKCMHSLSAITSFSFPLAITYFCECKQGLWLHSSLSSWE